MGGVENTNTATSLVNDLSSTFAQTAMQQLGKEAQLTKLTFPMATVGLRFYLPRKDVNLKDQIFGEMESTALKVDSAVQSMVNRMGEGEGLGASLRENFSKAVSSVQTIGLDFVDVQKAAEATLDTFGRNVSLSEKEYTNLLSTQEVTGVQSDKLLQGFADAGMSIKDITSEMNTVLDVSNAIGVNAKLVSGKVVENLDKLNKFGFQNGIEGLAKMAAKAQILRIDMKEIFTLADTLLDPEGAIDLASSLQRLGATSAALTDPLRLMDMAQNDVGALTDELGKMFSQYAEFNEENQKFEILPGARLEIRQLEQDLKLPAGTIEKMALGTKDLEKKLSEISFSGFDIPQDTQELIANMSMMGESGEYMIKYVDEEGKSREETTAQFLEDFGNDVEGMKKALGKQKEIEGETADEKMYRRAGEQLTSLQTIAAQNNSAMSALGLAMGGGEFGKQVLETNERVAKDFNKSIQENLGPNSDIAKSFNDVAKANRDAMDVITGKKEGDAKEELKKVYDNMTKILDSTVTAVGATITGIATDVGTTLGIEVPSFSGLAESLGVTDESLNKFNESLKNGSETINGYITKGLSLIGLTSETTPNEKNVTGEIPTAIPTPLEQTIEITAPPEISTAENTINPNVNVTTEGTVVNPIVPPTETTASTEVGTEQTGTVVNPVIPTEATVTNTNITNFEKDLGLKAGTLEDMSVTAAMTSGGFDISQMMVGPAEASLEGGTYDFSQFQPINQVLQKKEVNPEAVTTNNNQNSQFVNDVTTINTQLSNDIVNTNTQLVNDITTANTQLVNDFTSTNNNQNSQFVNDITTANTQLSNDIKNVNIQDKKTLVNLELPKPESEKKIITETNFGFETSELISEVKGTSQIVDEFITGLKDNSQIINNFLKKPEENKQVNTALNNQTIGEVPKFLAKPTETAPENEKFNLGQVIPVLQTLTQDIKNQSDSFVEGTKNINSTVLNNPKTEETNNILSNINSSSNEQTKILNNNDTKNTVINPNTTSVTTAINTIGEVPKFLAKPTETTPGATTFRIEEVVPVLQMLTQDIKNQTNTTQEGDKNLNQQLINLNNSTEENNKSNVNVSSVLSEGKNVTQVMKDKEKETTLSSEVTNSFKNSSEISEKLHEKLATLYENNRFYTPTPVQESTVKPDVNVNVKGGETVVTPEIPKPESEKKIITESNFGNEVPVSVADFQGAEQIISQFTTPETTVKPNVNVNVEGGATISKADLPKVETVETEEGKTGINTKEIENQKFITPEDKSVTNFVNQNSPKPAGVNLFDTKPSVLGEYTATGEIISQFATPDAIPAYATPPSETFDKKTEEYKKFMSNQNNQTLSLNENRNVKVDVNIAGSKDPQTERQLRETIINTIKNEMTYNNDYQRRVREASSDQNTNFGLLTSDIQAT